MTAPGKLIRRSSNPSSRPHARRHAPRRHQASAAAAWSSPASRTIPPRESEVDRILSVKDRRGGSPVDSDTYQRGLEVRSAVLGEAYVNKALADADDFTKPLQDLVTEYCWGAVWGRDELPRKTRSMLNLAMISVLNRPNELRTHLKGALTNGVTREEIREIFRQVAIYAAAPAGVDSFRIAREVFAEIDKG